MRLWWVTASAHMCLIVQFHCSSVYIVSVYTRGVQKVRRLTQLTTRYAHHILLLFNIVTCN